VLTGHCHEGGLVPRGKLGQSATIKGSLTIMPRSLSFDENALILVKMSAFLVNQKSCTVAVHQRNEAAKPQAK
jgi:hypothetical protein